MSIFASLFGKPPRGEKGKSGEKPSVKYISDVFSDCCDFKKSTLRLGGNGETVTLVFMDGLVSGIAVAEDVIRPLTDPARFGGMTAAEAVKTAAEGAVYGYNARLRTSADDVVSDLLGGFCAVIFDSEGLALSFETRTGDKRSVDQPKEEKVVRGSKDAFIEVMQTNTMLVRRRLRDRELKIKEVKIGKSPGTGAVLIYINGFTNADIVAEAEKRLRAVKTEGILTAAAIEECLVDSPKTPFPQLIITERPDKFCMNLLEGRVGFLAEGLPMGFLAPGTFAQFFKTPEDSSMHFLVGTALTLLRYVAFLLSLILPAFFVAVAMYHQEMIPIKLLQSMIDAKQSVPLPTAAEVVLMLLAFELLQEAGLRLPNPIGQTVSLIGALIVGQSAVEAKVVSPVVVIVVALSGVAGYTMPDQDMSAAVRICRFLLVIAAIAGGMFGLAAFCALLLHHLCSLESFGVPYMTPFAGGSARQMVRGVTRGPLRKERTREPALSPKGDEE